MVSEDVRRYAAAAARASQGYAPGFTARRIVPTGRGWRMQTTYNPPALDTRSELDRWADARQAMGVGRPGDGRVYLDIISRALQSAASGLGRDVRRMATGSSGQYRGNRPTATRVNQTQPRQSTAKKATAKKSTAKKATAKKATAKKATAKKATKRTPTRRNVR